MSPAVRLAGPPIPGAVAALEAAPASGRKVAIISNNSTACVRAFLMLHELRQLVDVVVGRAPHRPDAMKSDPHSPLLASSELDTLPRDCTLIGGPVTDMEATKATGGRSIAYVNKPGKERAPGVLPYDVLDGGVVVAADAGARAVPGVGFGASSSADLHSPPRGALFWPTSLMLFPATLWIGALLSPYT
ncbi:HAD hydrolase-like protein [Streptomyces sp. Edi4]|uniref:HAD hydrolase-like protein n=1 Tax=Streptomyces sp. Edi4 TaxID=3162527 RepID=UPI003305F3B3